MASNLPTRNPDYTSNFGNTFWFEEMVCKVGDAWYVLEVNERNKLVTTSRKNDFVKPVQEAFVEWKNKKVESLLLTDDG